MKRPSRWRYSVKSLLAATAVVAVVLGGWIAYSKHKLQGLLQLRSEGAIVILRDRTPQALQSLGIRQLSPFFDVPTVELYVTSMGDKALVGMSDAWMPRASAEQRILQQAATARRNGAEDVQLILVDNFDPEWLAFAEANSLATIGDSKQRYLQRFRANQQSGANPNP